MTYSELFTHIELFAGIGAATTAAAMAGIELNTIAISEIDRYPLKLRKLIHPDCKAKNIGDLTSYGWTNEQFHDTDIVSGGFPCQSFSQMGKMKGWNCPDTIRITSALRDFVVFFLPKYVILENVTALFNKTNKAGTDQFLSSFLTDYNMDKTFHNPHDDGYMQSRTRAWIVLSRKDVPQWKIGKFCSLSKAQTWGDVKDSRILKDDLKGEYFHAKATARLSSKRTNKHWSISDNSTMFQCILKRSVCARCNRASWIENGSFHRSPTTNEFFRLFGYEKFPKQLTKKDKTLSRSAIARGFGNSWHVGAASQIFDMFPSYELEEWKFEQFIKDFIHVDAIESLANKRTAKKIRLHYSWDDLMTTPHGSPRKIRATSSHKFDMKNGMKVETQGAYLAPADEASDPSKGIFINTCAMSGECKFGCLRFTGHLALHGHSLVRVHKTLAFYAYPMRFVAQMITEVIEGAEKADARGDSYIFRGNGTTDILWERFIKIDKLVDAIKGLTMFYDYTKMGRARLSNLPSSYHLTFSVDEKKNTIKDAHAYLKAGYSVAIVMPDKDKVKALAWNNPRIIDGDLSDHRPQDPAGSIVLLRTKGTLRTQQTLFVKDLKWLASFVSSSPCAA